MLRRRTAGTRWSESAIWVAEKEDGSRSRPAWEGAPYNSLATTSLTTSWDERSSALLNLPR